jgi:hypothetical protein
MAENVEPEKLSGLVPDFYFELIARIIPGSIVILSFIYWSGRELKEVFSTFGVSALLLMAAWIIGVILDLGLYAACPKMLAPPELSSSLETVRALQPWDRRIYFKQYALLIFLRGMAVVCGLTALITVLMRFCSGELSGSPVIQVCSGWFSDLPVLHEHYLRYGLPCTVLQLVFFLSWRVHRARVDQYCQPHWQHPDFSI